MHLDQWEVCSRLLKSAHVKFICANQRHQRVLESFIEGDFYTSFYPFVVSSAKAESSKKLKEKYKISKTDKVLIYSGRLSSQKNIALLISEFNKLGKDYKLLLCGHYDDIINEQRELHYLPGFNFSMINKEIKKLNLDQKRVFYCGNLDRSELLNHLQISDIYISLSTYLLEDYGVAPLEAYMSGCSLLLSNWGGYNCFDRFDHVSLLESSLTDSGCWIDLSNLKAKLEELLTKNNDNQVGEIESKVNQSFLTGFNELIQARKKGFKLKTKKNTWNLGDQRASLLYYQHFKFLGSQKELSKDFTKCENYSELARKTTFLPSEKAREKYHSHALSKHFLNYYSMDIMPCFVDTLLTNDVYSYQNFFLRDAELSERDLNELKLKYPSAGFYSTHKLLQNCELVQNEHSEKKSQDTIVLSIAIDDIKKYKIELDNLKDSLGNYKKILVIDENKELLEGALNYLQLKSYECLKTIGECKRIKSGQADFYSLIDNKLCLDSFIQYDFLSRGFNQINLPKASQIDFSFSPYHGLNILKAQQ